MKPAQDSQNLVLENVWRKDVSAIRQRVFELWEAYSGPVATQAEDRLKQLAFVVKDEGGAVVGMSTAFKVYVKQLRNYFYAVRLMLAPAYRIPGLTSKLLVSTRDFFEAVHGQDEIPGRAIGLITLVENERLKQHRNEAIWPASGMVYIGNSGEGHHIRVYYFKGARISP